MILRILLAGILGGVVMFFWGYVAHMQLAFGYSAMKPIPNESIVLNHMKENMQEPGLYLFPWMSPNFTAEETTAYNNRFRHGPSGLMVYTPSNEAGPMEMLPVQLGIQLGTCVALCLLSAMLLAQAAPALPSYVMRLFFMLLIGLIAGIAVPVPMYTWYQFPSDFTSQSVAEQVIGFALAGILIAAIVRHRQPVAPKPAV